MKGSVVLCCLSAMACSLAARAHATILCEKALPRCTPATCAGGSTVGTDFTLYFIPGTHKSPAYSLCPAASGHSTCTNDRFRSSQSWDYVASTADYQYLWYPSMGFIAAGTAYVQVFDQSLKSQMTSSQWSNVTSISYIDVDVAWSTYGYCGISLEMLYSGVVAANWAGDYPSGTLDYVRLSYDPDTGTTWSKTKLSASRTYSFENTYDVDQNRQGIFIQSITETAGFQYSGGSCP